VAHITFRLVSSIYLNTNQKITEANVFRIDQIITASQFICYFREIAGHLSESGASQREVLVRKVSMR
jgi:hypothetical protein